MKTQTAKEGFNLTDGEVFAKEIALPDGAQDWYEVPETFTGKIAAWHLDKPMRLIITHSQNTAILTSVYGEVLYEYFNANNLVTRYEAEGIYIYLTTLLPEHRAILEGFGVIIQLTN